MFNSPIDEIKNRLDIVEVIGSYIKLQKAGINYRALCPFHSEKTASFFVSPVRQNWHCFGCSEGGSIFDFVMKIEGIEFGDALRILAQKAGVEFKQQAPEDKQWQTERQRLYEICELACCFFEKQLVSAQKGQEIGKYLLKRGISEESIKKWRIGYAPNQWQSLSDFLNSQGYDREEVVKAGLAVKTTDKYYDRFRGRIIFPIFDLNSQVVGFGGRVLENEKQDGAKYINTPNTLLYDKSRVLYGLNFAKTEIRKKDFVILTEGYFDVILVQQAGFENAIALSGTSLTSWQIKILKRYASNLYTAFDMDVAGDAATSKGIDFAQKEDFNIKVISLPKGMDPADVIAKDFNQWQGLVEKAQDVFDFYFQSAFAQFDQNKPEGKKEISNVLLLKIREIPNKILQAHWIQCLANKIKIKEEIVWEELKKITQKKEDNIVFKGVKIEETKNRKQLLEEKILFLILKNPEELKFLENDFFPLLSPQMKLIFDSFNDIGKLRKDNEDIKRILDKATLMAENESHFNKEQGIGDVKKEIAFCVQELKKIDSKNRLQDISGKIQEAEKSGEQKKIKDLVEKFNQITKELRA